MDAEHTRVFAIPLSGDQAMIDIKPNLAEAVAFAVSLPPEQVHLCAIPPPANRPVVGQGFSKNESRQAAPIRWSPGAVRRGYARTSHSIEANPPSTCPAKA